MLLTAVATRAVAAATAAALTDAIGVTFTARGRQTGESVLQRARVDNCFHARRRKRISRSGLRLRFAEHVFGGGIVGTGNLLDKPVERRYGLR